MDLQICSPLLCVWCRVFPLPMMIMSPQRYSADIVQVVGGWTSLARGRLWTNELWVVNVTAAPVATGWKEHPDAIMKLKPSLETNYVRFIYALEVTPSDVVIAGDYKLCELTLTEMVSNRCGVMRWAVPIVWDRISEHLWAAELV